MTGEITLRGKILPVGGLKEKILAALRAKIKTILIPEQNKKDLSEISPSVRRRLQFVLVQNIDEVIERALLIKKSKVKRLPIKGPRLEIRRPRQSSGAR
jgi:ATP-dependent Lon protease